MKEAIRKNDQRLPKTEILHKKKDFQKLFQQGQRWDCQYFRCLFYEANQRQVGFVVSRQFGNAVCRNRIKRRMREVYRKDKMKIPLIHMLIIPKKDFNKASYQDIETAFKKYVNDLA